MLTQVIPRTLFNNLLVAALFGILVPYLKGIEYLDLLLLLPYSFLSLFFVLPLAVDAVYASPERGVPLVGLFRSAVLGWAFGVAVLWMGIATVSWRSGRLVAPPVAVGLSLAVLSLFACIFAAAVAAWMANHTSDASTAKGRLRMGFLILLVVLMGIPRLISEDTLVWFLQYLTPEGLVRACLVVAPISAIATVAVLSRMARR